MSLKKRACPLTILFLLWITPTTSLVANEADSQRPNILLMTVDNLGYGDLLIYNPQSKILTPNLAKLASRGVRLTQFYTASPTCTVSRACLLTGRIAQRHGLINQLPGLEGNYGVGLNPKEILIPQILKSAGYRTGCFGKWNIGFAKGSRPTERGFDEFLGNASGNIDYYRHVYNGKHDVYRGTAGQPVTEHHATGTYSSDLFADAAIDFITRHQTKQPWFCYLPFNAPHSPNRKNKLPEQANEWQSPPEAFARYGMSEKETDPQLRYMATVTALDDAIGRVLDCLDEQGATDNTFIFCFSDNGAFRLDREGIDMGSNEPLRSGGVTCWEGGLRVAAIASFPGVIPAGSVVDQPLWSPDLMITYAKLTNAKLPKAKLDGKDALPILAGRSQSKHQSYYFEFRKHAALRMGNWKIVRTKPGEKWQLFDLKRDPSETDNQATVQPEKLAELIHEFKSWQAEF
ncbi:MAG: sulfatase-like hydrolase/transferase [Rubripirellula sp.]|nr:sulfatase-like hydrolase/transferase [Rubripirellula sp.]